MPKYYGVERSSEYLAHYGIKGMKWGVRKAKGAKNERKLDREFRKASRKLNKLNKKANWQKQNDRKTVADNTIAGLTLGGMASTLGAAKAINKIPKHLKIPALTSGIAGAALLSTPAVIASHKIKKRMLPEGHQKAVNEANAWAKEMNRVFHKTKYQGKAKPFDDNYLVRTVKYQPDEARRGNIMPYQTTYRRVSGTELANNYAKLYGKKRSRR